MTRSPLHDGTEAARGAPSRWALSARRAWGASIRTDGLFWWPGLTAAALGFALGVAGCALEADPCGAVAVCEPGTRCFADPCDRAARCASGPEAALYGRDAARDGGCAPSGDASCRRSQVSCAIWGQCAAPPAGWQPAGSCAEGSRHDGDFRASREAGCAGRGSCVALSHEDCARARVCALEGRCAAREGVCVAASAADCRSSELCRELGRCTLVAGSCRAVDAADCRASEACGDRGACGVASGGCGECDRSEGCVREGLCALAGVQCRATAAEHCRASRACQAEGRCRLDGGQCVK